MPANKLLLNTCLRKSVRLFLLPFFSVLIGVILVEVAYAHPSPNTLVFLNVSPNRVAMEIQMPVPELELAFGQSFAGTPETLVDRMGLQLKEYILTHTHAYVSKKRPWQVELTSI